MPITVFVADDHGLVRDGLVSLLAAEPDLRVVGTAADGREALRRIASVRPEVAILDIAMPQMNGLETARVLRERLPEVRVVILSMYSTVEHVFRALEAGAAGYVLKESAAQEIIEAVRAVCAGRRYLSPKIARATAGAVPARPQASPLERLSARERQILQLVAEGRSSVQIAAALNLSPKTVDTYRSRLMQKLGIGDTAGLVKFAIQHGLTPLE